MRSDALTFALLLTARLAAVCRRSCGVAPSSPAARAAGSTMRRRQVAEGPALDRFGVRRLLERAEGAALTTAGSGLGTAVATQAAEACGG